MNNYLNISDILSLNIVLKENYQQITIKVFNDFNVDNYINYNDNIINIFLKNKYVNFKYDYLNINDNIVIAIKYKKKGK